MSTNDDDSHDDDSQVIKLTGPASMFPLDDDSYPPFIRIDGEIYRVIEHVSEHEIRIRPIRESDTI
jgi:hypothetical protein